MTATLVPVYLDVTPAKGAVCFVWDDGYASHSTVVAAMAESRKQRHTFSVYTDALGAANRLTSAQVTTLYQNGHEIACHSKTHDVVTTASLADRIIAYDTAKTTLEGLTASGAVTTFVYPEGTRNATTDTELALRYNRAIGVSGGTPSSLPFLHHRSATQPFLVGRLEWDGTARAQAQVLSYIRLAASSPVTFVCYAHEIDANGSPTTAQLTAALDLAQSLKVPCVTLAEAFPKFNMLVDGGFEDSNLYAWYKIESGGTFTAESTADTPADGMGGTRSLHLESTSDSGTVYVQQTVPIVPGTAYTLSGRYRVDITSGAGSVAMRIRERTYTGASVGSTASSALTETSWAQGTVARTFGATGAFALIELEIVNLTAEAWFDHCVLAPTLMGVHG